MVMRAQPARSGFTVSADLIRGLIDCAEKCGLPRARFADLSPGDGQASKRYAGDHVVRLWDRVLRLGGDPIIGFRMARVAGLRTFGVLGLIAPRCATVLDAFRQAERYAALASQGANISIACDARTLTASLVLDLPPGPLRNNVALWGLTNLSLLPTRLMGTAVRPPEIACAFGSPGADAVRALEEHASFSFDAPLDRVVFDRSVGNLALASADADLKAVLAEAMERHLAELGPAGSFEQGLVAILREMLDGSMPTLKSPSARTGLSPRTLQRRLNGAKTSFHALLQRVLQERAEDLLAGGHLSQGEIAFLLGYSEVSAFSRAYRGWTGHPPGASEV